MSLPLRTAEAPSPHPREAEPQPARPEGTRPSRGATAWGPVVPQAGTCPGAGTLSTRSPRVPWGRAVAPPPSWARLGGRDGSHQTPVTGRCRLKTDLLTLPAIVLSRAQVLGPPSKIRRPVGAKGTIYL